MIEYHLTIIGNKQWYEGEMRHPFHYQDLVPFLKVLYRSRAESVTF